jgi:hypothetical protein
MSRWWIDVQKSKKLTFYENPKNLEEFFENVTIERLVELKGEIDKLQQYIFKSMSATGTIIKYKK